MKAPGLIQKMSGPFLPANAVVSFVPEYCSGGKVWKLTWTLGFAVFQRLTADLITGSSCSATNFQNCSVTLPPDDALLSLSLPPQALSSDPSVVMPAPAASARPVNARRVSPPSSR